MPRRSRGRISPEPGARSSLRRARAAEDAAFHGDFDTLAGHRHRRQHRDFQPGGYRVAAHVAGAQPGTTGDFEMVGQSAAGRVALLRQFEPQGWPGAVSNEHLLVGCVGGSARPQPDALRCVRVLAPGTARRDGEWRASSGGRLAGYRQLLLRPGREHAVGQADCGRRRHRGWRSRRGGELPLLGARLRAGPGGHRENHLHQPRAVRGGGGDAAGVLRGFGWRIRRHSRSRRYLAHSSQGPVQLGQPNLHTILCARPVLDPNDGPGEVRQRGTRVAGGTHRHSDREHAGSRSARPADRDRAHRIRAGEPGVGLSAKPLSAASSDSHDGGRPDAADGLRQPGRAADGARHGPAQGDRASAGVGGRPPAAGLAVAGGRRPAFAGRRGGRTAAGVLGRRCSAGHGLVRTGRDSAPSASGCPDTGLHGGHFPSDHPAVRPRPGASRDAFEPGLCNEGGYAARAREPAFRAGENAGGGADCRGAAAAGGSHAFHAQSRQPAGHPSGVRPQERGAVRPGARAERLR